MRKVIFLAIALASISVHTNGSVSFSSKNINAHLDKNLVKTIVSATTVDKTSHIFDAEESGQDIDANGIANEYLSGEPSIAGLPVIPAAPDVPTLTNNCGNTLLTRGTPPTGVTWYWQGTSSSSTSTANFAETYTVSTNGTYYIKAKDNTTGEWSASTGVAVVINALPAMPSTPSVANNCANSVITRATPPAGVIWYWQGTNSNGVNTDNSNTTYTVTADGTYYIRARNNTTGCWSTTSNVKSVTITKLPDAPTSPTITSTNCGNSVLTKATSPSGTSWYWQGTNINGTSTSNNASTYTVTVDGTYYLRTYFASTGCWSAVSASVTVDVNDLPPTPFAPTVISSSCETVKLSHSASPAGITWYWQGTTSAGTSTINSDATYDVTSNGTYYLRARNDATGCWSTTSASIAINSLTAPATPTLPTVSSSICGSSVLTRVASPVNETWYWQGQNANGTNTDNSATTLTITSDGNYYLRAKNNSTGCWSASSNGTNFDVQEIPSVPTTPTISSSSCGSVVIAKGTSPNDIVWFWQGINNDGKTNTGSVASYATYTINSSGTYYLRANKGSCWSTSSSIVVNVGIPDVPLTPVIVSSSCEKVVLSISDTPPNGTTWYWQGTNSNGTSTENSNSTFEATGNGTYYLKARNNTTGCWNTTNSSIVINSINPPAQPTTPTLTSSICGSSVLTRIASPANETWYWQGQNSNGTSTDNPALTFTVTNDGYYYLRAKNNTTGCWSFTSARIQTAVKEIPSLPNPPVINSSSCGNVIISRGTPPTNVNWNWQGTDPNGTTTSGSAGQINYYAQSDGTYYLRAYDANSACWSLSSSSITVDVDNPVVPNIPLITSSSCDKVILSIDGTPPTGYTWYWQDKQSSGTSTLNSSSTYEATSNGNYYLRARNNSTGCWGSYTSVTISSINLPAIPPIPTITINDCSGIVITRVTPPAGETWYWQGTNINGTDISNSGLNNNAVNGHRNYLRARNDVTGCWSTYSSSIYPNGKEIPDKPIAPLVTFTNGNYVFTRGVPIGYDVWLWQGNQNNGTSASNSNLTYTTNLQGVYYLRARNSQSGCWSIESASASTDQILFVSAPPTPRIENTCGSAMLRNLGTPPQGVTYYWQGTNSDGVSTDNSGGSITVTSDGTYYIRARNDATGIWSASTPIVVDVMEIPDTPTIPSQNTMCGVTELTTSIPPAGITWYWQGTSGDSKTTTNSTPTYRVTVDGTYYLRALSNTNGCWSINSAPIAVAIQVQPSTPVPPTLQSSSCGSSVIVQGAAPTGVTWFWQGNNYIGTSTDNSGVSYTVDHDGTYYLRSKDNATGCWSTTSSSIVVTVNEIPDIPIQPYVFSNTCGLTTLTRLNLPPTNVTWYWQDKQVNGQSTTSSGVNYQSTSDGVYYLRAKNDFTGCWSQASASVSVDVIEPPAMPATPTVSYDGSTTILTRSASPNGVNWYWQGTINNGGSLVNSNSTYGVTSSGTYYLSAKDEITGCWSSSSASVTVQVNALPATPTIPTLQSSSCGSSVLLHGTPPDGVTWYWQGTSANGISTAYPDLTFTAQTDGTYYLRALDNVTGNWSATSSSLVVNVNEIPETPTPPQVRLNSCGQTSIYRYTPPWNETWYWQDNVINGQSTSNSSVSYSAYTDGTYYLRAQNISSGCWSASSASITVDVIDVPAITTQPVSATFCEGGSAIYNITATGTNVKLQWQRSTNNGGSWEILQGETGSTLTINSITPLMQNLQFKCKVTGDCPPIINSNVVTLLVSPLPTLYSVTGGGSYCSGSSGVTVGLSGSQIGVNYQLNINGNNVGATFPGTGSDIDFGEQLVAGTYTVFASNANGCSRIMTGNKTVTILTPPTAAISADRTLVTCLIPNAILTASGDGTYQWSYDNGIIMDPTTVQITVSPLVNTIYKVTVTNANGCKTPASLQIITDKFNSEAPTSITADNTAICAGSSTTLTVNGGKLGTGASWKWTSGSCNDTYIGTGKSIPVTVLTTTTYFVKAVGDCNTTECTSITINVYPCTYTGSDNLPKNWTETTVYNEIGSIVGHTISYADWLGRGLQTQSAALTSGHTLVTQVVYDDLGRQVISTLPAAVNNPSLAYKPDFFTDLTGKSYSPSNFDGTLLNDPDKVNAAMPNGLGWYYSSNNTTESYVPESSYPYSRVEFSNITGQTRRSAAAGEAYKMGSGHETYGFAMPAVVDELGSFRNNVLNFPTTAISKSISNDAEGKQLVAFTDAQGRTIASGRVGGGANIHVNGTLSSTIGYLDVHIAAGCENSLVLPSGHSYIVTNLLTEQVVGSITAGFYRIEATTDVDIPIGYDVNYSDLSFNGYDLAGRLKESYSPMAVATPNPTLKTTYTYNTLGWLLETSDYEKGLSQFVYRNDGSIRFSQNAKQKAETTDNVFSYTNYDESNRPVESGEYRGIIAFSPTMDPITTILPTADCKETTNTSYDLPDASLSTIISGYSQNFTVGRVSKTWNENSTTWYSYTYDGRVEWIVRNIKDMNPVTVNYTYDFNGNVTKVEYQKENNAERFDHLYTYDKDLRLSEVNTKTYSQTIPELQAKYYYYAHGPLKRVEYGDKLQGVDYAYTLNGALKAINDPMLSSSDPGKDGYLDKDGNNGPHTDYGKDLFGMALDYYNGDYTRTGVNFGSVSGNDRFDGLITTQRWRTLHNNLVTPLPGQSWLYSYTYDSRNYLQDAKFGTFDPSSGTVSIDNKYSEKGMTYDPNGNIEKLDRYNSSVNAMDNLTYNYIFAGKPNQLSSIVDGSSDPTIGSLSGTNSFTYNAIGQMTSKTEGVTTEYFKYNPYGLTAGIYTDSAFTTPKVEFTYDDNGFRVWKKDYISVGQPETFYVRDASGNIIATYEKKGSTTVTLFELPVYGSGRIGTMNSALHTTYELTDHLGNVRALFGKATNGLVQLEGYTDYYPYGMVMPGRQYVLGNRYRFGYQGQYAEKDEETGLDHFEARDYDSRIGRWLSFDPARQFWSPYLGMGNNPVSRVDPDGKESPTDFIDATYGDRIHVEDGYTNTFTIDHDQFNNLTNILETGNVNKYCDFLHYYWGIERAVVVEDVIVRGFKEFGLIIAGEAAFEVVAEGVSILKNAYSTYKATQSGARVFWSGGEIAKTAAADFAKANGMKTLEMTTNGRIMNTLSPYLPRSISRPIWDRLSTNFARGATGDINVFQNAAGVGLKSTWTRIEYPILQNNNIIYNIVR